MGRVRPRRGCCRAADAPRSCRLGAADPSDGDAGVAIDFHRMAEPRFPEIAGPRTVDPGSALDRLCKRRAAPADPAAAAAWPRPYDASAWSARRCSGDRRAARGGRPARAQLGRPDRTRGALAARRLACPPCAAPAIPSAALTLVFAVALALPTALHPIVRT